MTNYPTVMIEKLIKEVFKKAEKETGNRTKGGLSRHLEHHLREDFKCFDGTSYKTIERSYEKYIDKSKPENASPGAVLLDVMSKYLGYSSFSDFRNQNEKDLSNTGVAIAKQSKSKLSVERVLIVILGISLFGLLSYHIITTLDDEHICMVWKANHYEKVSCDLSEHFGVENSIIPFDEKLYNNMKKIPYREVKIGSSYYYKINKDSLEYFSWHGLHPINKEDLKPVTPYIYDKYLQPYFDKQITQEK